MSSPLQVRPSSRHLTALAPVRAPRPAKEPLWRHVVGDVLRRERLRQERTLKDVSAAARISMPYLSELERGLKEASSEILAAAARALGLSMADVLARAHDTLARAERARTGPAGPRQLTSSRSLSSGPALAHPDDTDPDAAHAVTSLADLAGRHTDAPGFTVSVAA